MREFLFWLQEAHLFRHARISLLVRGFLGTCYIEFDYSILFLFNWCPQFHIYPVYQTRSIFYRLGKDSNTFPDVYVLLLRLLFASAFSFSVIIWVIFNIMLHFDNTEISRCFFHLPRKFTYLGSSVSSTETYIDTRLAKAWTAIDLHINIWFQVFILEFLWFIYMV